jgi:hypothetical protein
MCEWCREYLAQMRATIAAVAGEAQAAQPPPAPTLAELVGAYRRRTQGGPAR